MERDPQLVLRDVIEGLVSAQAALRQYGVVLTADQTAIDEAATIAQRAAMNCCPTKEGEGAVMFQNLARKPTGWRPTLRRPMLAAIPAVAIVAAVAAAGGTASAGTRAHASPKLTSLSIEDVPFYANAPLALGQKVGIFKHYGLTVSLQTASNVNVILADLHSGLSQLGFATTPLVLNADEAGQDVRCVAPMGPANAVNPAFPQNAVMVAKDSNITSLSQLQGKTVGTQPAGR